MSGSHVAPATHEVRGSLTWTEHGDAPYWAVLALVRAADGGGTYELEIDGEPIDVSLGYKSSGVSPRPSDDVDEIREFKLFWTREDGLRFGGFIKPYFGPDEFRQKAPEDVPFEDRQEISVPGDVQPATVFEVKAGKYADHGYYADYLPDVLEALASELGVGWHPDYFRSTPHRFSTITDLERTLRIEREAATKLVRGDGIMRRLFQLLANEKGSTVEYTADNEEIVGHFHEIELDRASANELLPHRSVPGVQIKVYHPKHVREELDEDDPLYHPRIGILFKKSLNRSGWSFLEADELEAVLDELLLNLLGWGGLPTEPSTPPYIPDDHQEVEPLGRSIAIVEDPTPKIETRQESLLIRSLIELGETDIERTRDLLADGGQAHYEAFADKRDEHPATAYRYLDRASDLVTSDDGVLRFISIRQRQIARKLLEPVEDHVAATTRAVASVLDLDRRRLEQKGAAFQEWVKQYAVELLDADDGDLEKLRIEAMLDRLRSTSHPRVEDVLERGLRAWREAGLKRETFLDLTVTYRSPEGHRSVRPRSILG